MARIWELCLRICRRCLQFVVNLFGIELTEEKWSLCEQFIKFSMVGCSNALVTLIVCDGIILMFGEHVYLIGQTVGYIVGIFNSYFWNSRVVFHGGKQNGTSAFVRMCLCYGMTYFLQMGLLYVFVQLCKWSALLSPAIVIVITTPINFVLNRLWAFKKRKK